MLKNESSEKSCKNVWNYERPCERTFIHPFTKYSERRSAHPFKFFIAYLNNLETTHLSILFFVYLKVNTKEKELECRHDIITRTINLAAQLGISIGNETQLVQLVNEPEHPTKKKDESP